MLIHNPYACDVCTTPMVKDDAGWWCMVRESAVFTLARFSPMLAKGLSVEHVCCAKCVHVAVEGWMNGPNPATPTVGADSETGMTFAAAAGTATATSTKTSGEASLKKRIPVSAQKEWKEHK